MKRFFTKIVRFFWSWGFLKFVLGMIALIILLYLEEDWRDAHAWATTKAKWEAKGESFDYAKFIPPPISDDQNLAAIPLFKIEPIKSSYDNTTYMGQATLNHAMRDDLPNLDFPHMGNWQKGEPTDMAEVKKTMAADYALAFKNGTAPDDTLELFNAIYPFFTDFMVASATHPFFRLNLDYTISPPAIRPLGPITTGIKLSKILTLHSILALDHHQPDLALKDIETNYKILAGVKRDPSLVGGLVAIGMTAINNAALYDGLAQHAWSDAQLVELDDTLKPINFLADYQFAMRSEAVGSVYNFELFKKYAARSTFGGLFYATANPDHPALMEFFPRWPDGWWDDNQSQLVDFLLDQTTTVDAASRLAFPHAESDKQNKLEQARASWTAIAPWNIFFFISAPPLSQSMQKFAQAQVWIDEARIACALERYHLAKGVYPDALAALAPACIDELPHDIMNGQPYHYSLRPDGAFLLYSVGWNQADDGGKIAYKQDSPTQIDYTQGDWVWPTPHAVK
jgi:hypothetical protein